MVKERQAVLVGYFGCIVLVLYGVVATWQTADFGRVYAAYGGIFIMGM
jgi:small multidrug resistance family-3 protein